jgi:hypothetical protein
MFRRLLVGAVIVAAIAGVNSPWQADRTVEAAPANVIGSISFGTGVDDQAQVTGEGVEFSSDPGTIWASFPFSGVGSGTQWTYVLRLNGTDFAWGDINCCGSTTSGRMAIPLVQPSNGAELPGGAYRLYIYEGSQEVGNGGFGVRGDDGADSGDPESNSNPDDDDDDDDDD